jgi:hypothetical protein
MDSFFLTKIYFVGDSDWCRTVGEVFGNKGLSLDAFTLEQTVKQALEDAQRELGADVIPPHSSTRLFLLVLV